MKCCGAESWSRGAGGAGGNRDGELVGLLVELRGYRRNGGREQDKETRTKSWEAAGEGG